jgi:hypothetical protein
MTDSNFGGRENWPVASKSDVFVNETGSVLAPTLVFSPTFLIGRTSLLVPICWLEVAAFGAGPSRSVRLPLLAAVFDERVRGGRAVGRGGCAATRINGIDEGPICASLRFGWRRIGCKRRAMDDGPVCIPERLRPWA